jgi:hypothetical protein
MKTLADTDEIKNTTPFIGFVDLIGKGNVKLTIVDVEDVSGDKVDGVREAKRGTYALVLKGTDRKLLIQGRKKKFLMRTFGSKKSDWVGKVVEIYGDPAVKFGRETVGGWKFVGMEAAAA